MAKQLVSLDKVLNIIGNNMEIQDKRLMRYLEEDNRLEAEKCASAYLELAVLRKTLERLRNEGEDERVRRVYVNQIDDKAYPYEVEMMTVSGRLVNQAYYATLGEAIRRGTALGKYHNVDTYVFTGELYASDGNRYHAITPTKK